MTWFYVSLAKARPIGFIGATFIEADGPHSPEMKRKLGKLRDSDPHIPTCEVLILNTAHTVPPPCGELVLMRDPFMIDLAVTTWNLSNGFPESGAPDYDVREHFVDFYDIKVDPT